MKVTWDVLEELQERVRQFALHCWMLKTFCLSMFNNPEWVGLFCTQVMCDFVNLRLQTKRAFKCFTFYLDVCLRRCFTLQNGFVETFGFVLLTHSVMSSHLYIAHLLLCGSQKKSALVWNEPSQIKKMVWAAINFLSLKNLCSLERLLLLWRLQMESIFAVWPLT